MYGLLHPFRLNSAAVAPQASIASRPGSPRRSSSLALPLLAALAVGCSAGSTGLAPLEPGEELPGGDTTNTLLLGTNAYIRHAQNITPEHEAMFFTGNSFFNQGWVQAPSSTETRDGLGPLFNARSCAACHFKDGRGAPPKGDEDFVGLLLRLSVAGEGPHGEAVPDPNYGGQLQPFGILGVPGEGRPYIEREEVPGEYGDGTPFSLEQPTYVIDELAYGPLSDDIRISPRVAPAVIGLGLLEAIDSTRLMALSDPDDDNGDGISGRPNLVWDASVEQMVIGRFGWKAEQPSVRQQSAGAFLGDMGITSEMNPNQACSDVQTECLEAAEGGEPEIESHLLDRVTVYSQLLAVPMRERYSDDEVLRGKQLFADAGCAGCHVPSHRTAADAALEEVRDQQIWPYTDLLLHDMGEALSDHRPSFAAEGSEWRTPPLWGLRFIEVVNGHNRLMHDGRARGVAEAILWHGGEGEASKEAFRMMSADDRAALVTFVESL